MVQCGPSIMCHPTVRFSCFHFYRLYVSIFLSPIVAKMVFLNFDTSSLEHTRVERVAKRNQIKETIRMQLLR